MLFFGQLAGVAARLGSEVAEAAMADCRGRLVAGAGPTEVVGQLGPDVLVVARVAGGEACEPWASRLQRRVDAPVRTHGVELRLTSQVAVSATRAVGWPCGEALVEHVEHAAIRRRLVDADLFVHLPDATPGDDPWIGAHRLEAALRDGEIALRYQPVIDLASGRLVGAEALARWDRSGPDLRGPAQFLGLARAVGALPRITEHLVDQACQEFATGVPAHGGWWVAVNLGPEEAVAPETVGLVRTALRRSGLAPERLCLELSEQTVADPLAARALGHLADLGVRLAIDDFGSGFSSLAQIRSLPVSLVKIDRSVVAGAATDGLALLHAIVELASALGLTVLAEGIERPGELRAVHEAGVELGQGFLWGPATRVDELVGVIDR